MGSPINDLQNSTTRHDTIPQNSERKPKGGWIRSFKSCGGKLNGGAGGEVSELGVQGGERTGVGLVVELGGDGVVGRAEVGRPVKEGGLSITSRGDCELIP